ncbi:hypothetical protein [Alkalimarinus coralli]|uniref:hypothetical protein n=1 Tax=Alkalimarinus coralli TaxID=2935863 RepID=UPI00202B88E8|nr:hypothetical protein [Alkalimarinus coralli]
MQRLVYALIIAVFFFDYIASQTGAGRAIALVPELLSGLATVLIIFEWVRSKQIFISAKYIFIFILFCLLAVIGVVLNDVEPGAIVAGIRNHFKFVPFFLLPALFYSTDKELSVQFKVVLIILLIQVPLAYFQRYIQYPNKLTGDVVSGTVGISSILSILLISSIAILVGFYFKNRIPLRWLAILSLFLFLPTVINETKGTLFLLPIALFVPMFFAMISNRSRIKNILPMICISSLLIGGFVALYHQPKEEKEQNIINFVTEGKMQKYLYKQNTEGDVTTIGKFDSIVIALNHMSQNIPKLFFGLGIGNVAPSFSEKFSGEYSESHVRYGVNITSIGYLIWETGLIGLILILCGCYFVFSDAIYLSKSETISGDFAIGWAAVMVIFTVSLMYKNILVENVIIYLVAYFSGVIASRRRYLQYGFTGEPKTA